VPKGICSSAHLTDKPGGVPTAVVAAATLKHPQGAISIHFEIDTSLADYPADQLDLKREIESVLQAVQTLYLDRNRVPTSERFGGYLAGLHQIALLGLVGSNAQPKVASHALAGMVTELLDTEGTALKQRGLSTLASLAFRFSFVLLLLYFMLRVGHASKAFAGLGSTLGIDPLILANFCLLWVGCFLGVVLSYGIRKTSLQLADFLRSDADRLLPGTRLLFAGALTMLIGMLLFFGAVEIKLGSFTTADLAAFPMAAFLIGAVCGISELALPNFLSERAAKALKV